jgi:hypothetical protein
MISMTLTPLLLMLPRPLLQRAFRSVGGSTPSPLARLFPRQSQIGIIGFWNVWPRVAFQPDGDTFMTLVITGVRLNRRRALMSQNSKCHFDFVGLRAVMASEFQFVFGWSIEGGGGLSFVLRCGGNKREWTLLVKVYVLRVEVCCHR